MNEIWGAIAVLGVFVAGQLGLAIWTVATLQTKVTNIESKLTRFVELAEDHNERVVRLEEQANYRDKTTAAWHAKVEDKFNGIHRRLDRTEEMRGG